MSDIGIAMLSAGATCFATLLVTYIFNWFTNRPKKRREEEAKKEETRKQELVEMENRLTSKIEDVRQERITERELCGKDHASLVKLISQIQSDNEAQAIGIQLMLREDLKKQYTYWIHEGYASLETRDELEKLYNAYHKLKGNGLITELHNQFMSLPIEKK